MKDFNSSLLREKFVIQDPKADMDTNKTVFAVSNRMAVDLKSNLGENQERFVIRAQNMHLCIRMATRILQSYMQSGKIMDRKEEYDWPTIWKSIVNEFERKYNPSRWVAVYYKGRVVFEDGEDRHPFLDVIEKCAATKDSVYEEAIPMAEDAFRKTGKVVNINYDGNVALVVHLERNHGRCSVILRGPNKTTTFNFTATPNPKELLNFTQCLAMAANFLEGIQLAFRVGMNEEKLKLGIISPRSDEGEEHKDAKRRLSFLSSQISTMESSFKVRYRPERPEFHYIVNDTEKLAHKILQEEGGQASQSSVDEVDSLSEPPESSDMDE